MSATARRKRPGPADSESQVYLDRSAVGTILVEKGQVTALDAAGASLGTFATDKEAMRKIIAAARARAAA